MTAIRIHLLISIHYYILLVFHSDAHAWQFRVVSHSRVYGEQKLYYLAEAAEQAGRAWVNKGS